METIEYIIKRILIIIKLFNIRKYKIFPNLYYIKYNDKTNYKVLFYFPDPVMMHLGDHLFFEPVCRLFIRNGYNVEIAPTDLMAGYFTGNNYKVVNSANLGNYDLIITSTRFLISLNKIKCNIIYVRTECPDINKPLINDLIDKFSYLFKFEMTVPAKPLYYKSGEPVSIKMEKNKQYIIYNNYLVSGSFRVNPKLFSRLEQFIIRFLKENPGFGVIHTGTSRDLAKDKKSYSFVDIDLRGKTSVKDLFDLCSVENVRYYIGFDGFLMHLFFLQNKKAYVMSRGRWSKIAEYFLENYIDPPYYVEDVSVIKKYIR